MDGTGYLFDEEVRGSYNRGIPRWDQDRYEASLMRDGEPSGDLRLVPVNERLVVSTFRRAGSQGWGCSLFAIYSSRVPACENDADQDEGEGGERAHLLDRRRDGRLASDALGLRALQMEDDWAGEGDARCALDDQA